MCGVYSMCALQWWRATTQCPTRYAQEDLVVRRLECQSLESWSLLSSSWLSSHLSSIKVATATNTTGYAMTTGATSAMLVRRKATVPEWDVATTAITIQLLNDVICSMTAVAAATAIMSCFASLSLIQQLLTATMCQTRSSRDLGLGLETVFWKSWSRCLRSWSWYCFPAAK